MRTFGMNVLQVGPNEYMVKDPIWAHPDLHGKYARSAVPDAQFLGHVDS